jgi:predicted MFS family arabinose efflux permease
LSVFVSAVGLFAVFLFLTYFLQGMLGFSPVKTGFAFLPMPAVISVTVVVASTRLLPRTGPRPLVSTGMVLAAIGMYTFTHLSVSGHYVTQVLPGLIVTAAGMGLVFAPSMNLATFRVDREHAGVASATVNVAQQVGGSIGTALLNTIAVSTTATFVATTSGPTAVARGLIRGYDTSFWWATAIFAAGAIVAFTVLPKGPVDFSVGGDVDAPVLSH